MLLCTKREFVGAFVLRMIDDTYIIKLHGITPLLWMFSSWSESLTLAILAVKLKQTWKGSLAAPGNNKNSGAESDDDSTPKS